MADDFLFGLRFEFDNTGFLRGSEEAQDQLERTVAAIAHARRRTDEEVEALAKALSLSAAEVRKSLSDMEKAERDYEREQERMRAAQERRQAEQHRAEMEALRERTRAVTSLRDALLSVAAITMGGHGFAGVSSLVQDTSQRGVEESMFAQRTGTNMRQNIAEEEGAYLSGYSSREEARQSIGAFRNAASEYAQTGHSGLTDALIRAGIQIRPEFFNMRHDRAVEEIVRQMQAMGFDQQRQAFLLEQSGLTSGGYTNLALNPDLMDEYNRRGMERAGRLADSERQDIQFRRQWNDLRSDVAMFRSDMGHILEPWVGELDSFVKKLDTLAKEHPDAARNIVAATAVAVALGGLFSAIMPIIGPLLAIKALVGTSGTPPAVPPAGGAEAGGSATAAAEGAAATATTRGLPARAASLVLRRIFPAMLGAYIAEEAGAAHLSANDTLHASAHFRSVLGNESNFQAYAEEVAGIEHARYDQMGGSGNAYAGKYQMSRGAIIDAAHWLHEAVPTQAQFLADPAMQERFFRAYTASNERTLNLKSYQFRNASDEQKLAVLGYAHNQGAGGALKWMRTGVAGRDGFNTDATRYSQAIMHRLPIGGNVTHDNSTAIHIGHLTVRSNDPQDMARKLTNLAPNKMALTANTGQG